MMAGVLGQADGDGCTGVMPCRRMISSIFARSGGPMALVGQMERELVDGKKWLTKGQMREAIAICQSLPGALAIEVGIYIAYLRCGFWGAWASSFSRPARSLSAAGL